MLVDGKLEKADLSYLGKANRARASADSFSKVVREYSSNLKYLQLLVSFEDYCFGLLLWVDGKSIQKM